MSCRSSYGLPATARRSVLVCLPALAYVVASLIGQPEPARATCKPTCTNPECIFDNNSNYWVVPQGNGVSGCPLIVIDDVTTGTTCTGSKLVTIIPGINGNHVCAPAGSTPAAASCSYGTGTRVSLTCCNTACGMAPSPSASGGAGGTETKLRGSPVQTD
jgi:hypothetical protein